MAFTVNDVEAALGDPPLPSGTGNWMLSAMSEDRWWSEFSGRFSCFVRRSKLVNSGELDCFEAAHDAYAISDEEALTVRTLDMLVEGVTGRGADRRDLILAVKVSTRIREHHIDAAAAAAAVLRCVGYNAEAVVAGSVMRYELKATASAAGVSVLLCPCDLIWLSEGASPS